MIKTKLFTLILFSAILSLAIISAASLNDITVFNSPDSVDHDDETFEITFNLVNEGGASDINWITSMSQGVATFDFSHDSITDGSNTPITLTVTATVTFPEHQSGSLEGTITADPVSQGSSKSFTFNKVDINNEPELSVEDATIDVLDTMVTLTVENTGNIDFDDVELEVQDVTGIEFGTVTKFDLPAGESKDIEVNVDINENSLEIGTNDATITVTADDETATGKVILEKEYCEIGDIGVLKIDKLKFRNNGESGFGDKDEWYLTDEIEVEIKIENTDKDKDVDDIIIEWGLFDKENNEFVIDDEEKPDFNLDDDESETVKFSFTLDPDDFDEDYSDNDFEFFIKAWSDDENEDVQCVSESEKITVIKDDNFVLINDIELISDIVPCGEELAGSFRAWNVGEDTEDDVYVIVTNEELEINERINIGDIDVLEDVKRTFSFIIPEDAKEKNHVLWFRIYDEDNDIFETDDDDEAIFSKNFDVQGQCDGRFGGGMIDDGDILINAVNDPSTPEAIAGEQYIIRATITNVGDEQGTFSVSVFGNSAWSNLASIDPQILVLNAGESKEASIVLNVDGDASGSKEFTIKATSGDQEKEQKVALSIKGDDVQLDAFSEHIRNNWFIYVIVLINIILIIAIILVIKSMVRPREVL